MGVISETFDPTGGPAGKVVHRSNALIVDSKTPGDPAELRLGALPDASEALGKWSGDRLSADGTNREECVLLILKQDAQGRGYAELYGQADGHGGDMSERDLLARFSHTHPFYRGIGGGVSPSDRPNEFRHPNGIVWFVIQDDGNLVVYQNRVQWDYATGRPIWWSGSQVDPAQTEMRPRPDQTTPSQPAPSQPTEPSHEDGLRFNYKGIDYHVLPGAQFIAELEDIFDVDLDASDAQAYHDGRMSGEQVLQKFRNKVADDDLSV